MRKVSSNGIAYKDTFARVFAVLDPEAFKSCFVSWVKSLQSALQEVIAIDGKTLCNSAELQNNRSAIHIVCAFATGARLVLAQQKVAKKSNEITAIPLLLKFRERAVTQLGLESLKAVISGKITPEEAGRISALRGVHHKTFETTELLER